jgi:hypothetical protein
LALSELLPGFSPTRAAINVIESLQKKGLPTGPLPDGSPNKMVQFLKSIIEGVDAEESENGFTQIVLDPKLPIRGVGKSF